MEIQLILFTNCEFYPVILLNSFSSNILFEDSKDSLRIQIYCLQIRTVKLPFQSVGHYIFFSLPYYTGFDLQYDVE